MRRKINIKLLLFHILVPLAAAGLIYFLIPNIAEHYESLRKPLDLSPVLFPVVGAILYPLIGLAAYLVDIRPQNSEIVMRVYYVQLLVNLFWMPIFFGVQNNLFASIWICLLFILSITTCILFYKEERKSGHLLLPYILWIMFMIYFTVAITIMN